MNNQSKELAPVMERGESFRRDLSPKLLLVDRSTREDGMGGVAGE